MTAQAEQCVAEARRWLGTRWRHRGRSRFGIDCIGLVVVSVTAAGLQVRDRQDYSREPWRDGLQRELLEHFGDPIAPAPGVMQPGDIALMRWDGQREPAHVGIIGDYAYGTRHAGLSLIHSYSLVAVTEHRIDAQWQRRIVEVYRPWQW